MATYKILKEQHYDKLISEIKTNSACRKDNCFVGKDTTDINYEEKEVSDNQLNFLKAKFNIQYSSTLALFKNENDLYRSLQQIKRTYNQAKKDVHFVRINKKYIFKVIDNKLLEPVKPIGL